MSRKPYEAPKVTRMDDIAGEFLADAVKGGMVPVRLAPAYFVHADAIAKKIGNVLRVMHESNGPTVTIDREDLAALVSTYMVLVQDEDGT